MVHYAHYYYKGTVSSDVGFYLSVWKIKSVLPVKLLMVFTFFILSLPGYTKFYLEKYFYENVS
jgi:hypothetical protein